MSHQRLLSFPICMMLPVLVGAVGLSSAHGQSASALMVKYCVDCHGGKEPEGGVDLQTLTQSTQWSRQFATWRQVLRQVADKRMPPKDAEQPSAAERARLLATIQADIAAAAKRHADDPGEIVLRRLTSAEYGYSIRDLTGLKLDLSTGFVDDAVGGEGFANVGRVQFMQDATLERYLAVAKKISDHAVIGSGAVRFYDDPGKTGFELSAITRIQQIYRRFGFRTASGEGGEAFGLEKYERAFMAAWKYRHRIPLGMPKATMARIAREEQIEPRFATYMYSVVTQSAPTFPTSEIVEGWRKLPDPAQGGKSVMAKTRAACRELYKTLAGWQNRFGQNAEAKEDAPVLDERSFQVTRAKAFDMNVNWPEGTKVAHLTIDIQSANRQAIAAAVVRWRKATIQFRFPDMRRKPGVPLTQHLSAATLKRLKPGVHPSGPKIGKTEFVTTRTGRVELELPIPAGARSAKLLARAELDVMASEDCVVRCTITQREETDQGKQVSALLGNPEGKAFANWKSGVLQFARALPQVSHYEPAPSDRDPIPFPFDNTYNNPERNHYHYAVKYHRNDQFLVQNMIDRGTRAELNQAWTDLLGSFEYHDAFLRFICKKYKIELGDRRAENLSDRWVSQLPAEIRPTVRSLATSRKQISSAFQAAQSRHITDVVRLAYRAWRRPLSDQQEKRLREFYESLRRNLKLSHRESLRALIARVFVAPEFLYRMEQPRKGTNKNQSVVALDDWELASRLSYLIWSSVPDDELRRLAAFGKLRSPTELVRQTKRMLRDPKARRMAGEFFGQWFGFYRFDRFQGVDVGRFPEFTETLRNSLHDQAVGFFDYIIREDRPVREILFADYTFLDQQLSQHYGVARVDSSSVRLVRTGGVRQRGGLLSLGAVLATTSAPRRTSPVKRGDWVMRRILGTPVPRPPADAGSIPADDVVADGHSVKSRLAAHRSKPACEGCHKRIDPLGFALENYDTLGRWRTKYRDGQPVESKGTLETGAAIDGINGLRMFLEQNEALFQQTLCRKLVGYTFGRSESIADVVLVQNMIKNARANGRFSHLVTTIVASRQFRYRRIQPSSDAATSTNKKGSPR